jgi:hypothetical protein
MIDEDALVEAMARARCEVAGFDPDKSNFTVWTSEGEVTWPYAWHAEADPLPSNSPLTVR